MLAVPTIGTLCPKTPTELFATALAVEVELEELVAETLDCVEAAKVPALNNKQDHRRRNIVEYWVSFGD